VIWVRERFRAISNEIPWSRLLRFAFAGSHVNPVSMYSLLYIHPGIAASVSLYDGDGIRCSPRAERRMGMNAAMMAALQPADEAVRSIPRSSPPYDTRCRCLHSESASCICRQPITSHY
jgi:hypothetical protein